LSFKFITAKKIKVELYFISLDIMKCLSHFNVLTKEFYERDPELVARDLLGKKLIRRINDSTLQGIIVETEAYYGYTDPASRAYNGKKSYNSLMWEEVGRSFIYNVHRFWMFNIVAHKKGEIGAVLIRAVEPEKGIEIMKKNRSVKILTQLTSGPGKLTIALNIDKRLNGCSVINSESEIIVVDNKFDFNMGFSHRIGVKRDLIKKLRFFIKGNKYVSK
jgi:DNA-3-methyladenine glycosylase